MATGHLQLLCQNFGTRCRRVLDLRILVAVKTIYSVTTTSYRSGLVTLVY